MNISLKLNTPCELINVTPYNPLISKCQIKVCYVGEKPNRNQSIITKETAREIANSLPGSPIVGYFNEATQDFEEHNRSIEISGGKMHFKDITKPYGFVDLNAKCWFQQYQDGDEVHEYLCTEGWIWTGQYPEAKRIIEQGNNQSMELDKDTINAYWSKDDNGKPQFFIINEAIISKLCILGDSFEPCFEGAQITNVQFSLEDEFKNELFSMMSELQKLLNEGGTPVTKYSVTVGDSVWTALYSYIDTTYPNIETNVSDYSIKGVYEEDSQKFTILQNNKDEKYYRLNFALDENNEFSASPDLVEVTDYTVDEEPQFTEDSINEFVAEFKKKKDDEESKDEEKPAKEEDKGDAAPAEDKAEPSEKKDDNESKSDSEEKSEEEDPDKKKGKKVKYDLNEIQEYVDLKNEFDALQTKYNAMETEFAVLKKFKDDADREAKREMINSFYMLSDDDKADCVANIDTYSIDDIEAKLSIICVRNKVSFARDDEEEPAAKDVTTYNLNDTSDEDSVPAWIKAIRSVAKEINN